MSRLENLGTIDDSRRAGGVPGVVRWVVPAGWVLAAVGYYGAWIAHGTAALTLSGADIGEFVKFLPGVLDGSLQVFRQIFYLPPLAVVVGVALLVGSRELRYPALARVLALILLAVPVSLQLLPPAWSPASLLSSEFRLQTIALMASWLLFAGFWLWGRLPVRLIGTLAAALALASAVLSVWQYLEVKGAIDAVYGTPPQTGWGFYVCQAGLLLMAAGGLVLAWRRPRRRSGSR